MTRILNILLLTVISIVASGQVSPDFEQIAFDFYRNTIQTDNPNSKKRLTIWVQVLKMMDFKFYPKCLSKSGNIIGDTLFLRQSQNIQIDTKGDKRFKIQEFGKGEKSRYPYSAVESCASNGGSINIVTILELDHKVRGDGFSYHIEMDRNGDVKNWCKGPLYY